MMRIPRKRAQIILIVATIAAVGTLLGYQLFRTLTVRVMELWLEECASDISK
jgi:hypothetical protein